MTLRQPLVVVALFAVLVAEGAASPASLRPPPRALATPASAARLQGMLADGLRKASSRLAAVPDHALGPGTTALRDAALRAAWNDILEALKLIWDFIRLLVDPTPLGDYGFRLDGGMAQGNLTLKQVRAWHLRDMTVQRLSLNLTTMCAVVDLLSPHVGLQTHYDADVSFDLEDGSGSPFPLFGEGSAAIDLWNIHMHTDVCVTSNPVTVQVGNLQLSVQNDTVDIQNLFCDGPISKLVSGIATDVVPAMIQEFQKEITAFLMDYINNLIKNMLPDNSTTISSNKV